MILGWIGWKNMMELVTRLAADQLKINKAENQRRDLISQASTVWREYNNSLSVCQGLQIPESGFNPEKMAAVFSEVITLPFSDTTFGWKVSALFCDAFLLLSPTWFSFVCSGEWSRRILSYGIYWFARRSPGPNQPVPLSHRGAQCQTSAGVVIETKNYILYILPSDLR